MAVRRATSVIVKLSCFHFLGHFSLHLIFVFRASSLTILGDFNRSALYDVFGASDIYFFSVDGFAPRWRLKVCLVRMMV